MRRLSFSFFTVVLVGSFGAIADPPEDYYETAEGKRGAALKAALHEIIDDHEEWSYNAAYEALKTLDRDPRDPDSVVGIYSRFSLNAALKSDGGKGWVREHVWPQSFGEFGTRKGAGTDLHHLRAADWSTNSARSNRSFAEGGLIYVDKSGNQFGETKSKKGDGIRTWEPPDAIKGDVARMVMYMAVRYEGGASGEPDLELAEKVLPKSNKNPLLGVRSQILRWHEEDPIDRAERDRNDLIYSGYQGNRNPFIDHPEFANAIWRSRAPGNASRSRNALVASMNESDSNDQIQIGTYNLYWLGTKMRYQKGLRTKKEVERIADFVTDELDLEIVAFEEVNVRKTGLNFNNKEQSPSQYRWLKARMMDAGYKFIEGRSGGSQNVVIAYDSNEVSLLSDGRELGKKRGSLRRPLAAEFRAGKFDFWFVAVHLKAKDGNIKSDQTRKSQSNELIASVNELIDQSGEHDVILAGDFNAESNHESIEVLYYDGGFYSQTWFNRRAKKSYDVSLLNPIYASLIDHIMVRPGDTKEMLKRSTIVYPPKNRDTYMDRYSDHLPVWTSFSVKADLD